MPSIPHQPPAPGPPDFCNLGVLLRALLLINAASLALAAARVHEPSEIWQEFLALAAFVEPALLMSLPVLCLARGTLRRLGRRTAFAAMLAIVLALVAALALAARSLGLATAFALPQMLLLAALATALLLGYLDLRARALSPALSEARLQALQARIRPHFLFNSINAVLSLIRSEPRRAERALGDLADLFRVLMADNRRLTTLAEEIELCRQYLELEQLRLGDRLRVVWHTDKMPGEALIPPLVLQPLLENAVYHGVEPASLHGEIMVNAYRTGGQVVIVLKNPYDAETSHHAGNKMAMVNIRERLALHFDAEASLRARAQSGVYQVTITLPYTTSQR